MKKVKEDQMAVKITWQIILEGINNQIALNIINLKDPKKIWDKLVNICSEIGQRIVYSIFQELLNYPRINTPKQYNKPVMQIFAKVRYLYKRFHTIMTLG